MEGRVCLYNYSCSSTSLPILQEILELDSACQEDTNLENFSQNILYICVEHYFDALNFIHKNNSSMAHLNKHVG